MNGTELQTAFEKIRNGDKEAFTLIYEDLKKPVFTVVYRTVGSKEIAEDITHDIFVKLFVTPPDTSVNNLRAWIFKMARNLAIDTVRKKKTTDLDELQVEAKDEYEPLETRLDLENALSALSKEEREVITLHVNAELTFAEIAKITEISLPAAYRRYRKALKTLHKLLNGETQ